MNQNYTKYAFTESVRKAQEKFGSRRSYAKMEKSGADQFLLSDREVSFIKNRDSFYMATVGENGWPYVQFRGGAKGFIQILDNQRLGFADFRGNMQYISTGNIEATGRAALILLDYPTRRRLKIWAETKILDPGQHPGLLNTMAVKDYGAVIERLFLFHVKAFDWNCPQHITPRYTEEEIRSGLMPEYPQLVNDCTPDPDQSSPPSKKARK